MKTRGITCYNLVFPPFILIFFAPLWLFILPVNALIDWWLLRAALRAQEVPESKALATAALLRVCLWGLAADLVGAGPALFLMCSDTALHRMWPFRYAQEAYYNPLAGGGAFSFMCLFIALTGLLIYVGNRFYCLRPLPLTPRQRHVTALVLAVLTAPWFFLLPLQWFL